MRDYCAKYKTPVNQYLTQYFIVPDTLYMYVVIGKTLKIRMEIIYSKHYSVLYSVLKILSNVDVQLFPPHLFACIVSSSRSSD